jgi:hypothetical protein
MKRFKFPLVSALLATLLVSGCATAPVPPAAGTARVAAVRDQFYVGGSYVGDPGKQLMAGQMYVERLTPAKVTRPLPLVLVHGAAQTASNWLSTPDGRQGWAERFLELGYVVYLVDQPARGRSAWHPDVNGKLRMFTAPQLERLFTASAQLGDWPQAKLHTQWPGTGRRGDAVFDAFYASQVQSLASDSETQELARAAGAGLGDRRRPAEPGQGHRGHRTVRSAVPQRGRRQSQGQGLGHHRHRRALRPARGRPGGDPDREAVGARRRGPDRLHPAAGAGAQAGQPGPGAGAGDHGRGLVPRAL